MALHVGFVSVGNEGVIFRVLNPAPARFSIEPAGDLVGIIVECHGEALPRGIEYFRRSIGGDLRGNAGGVAFMKGVFVGERRGAVFRHVAAGGAGFAEPGEEGILALATLDFPDAGGGVLLEIGALVPDPGERVVAAFTDRPDYD